MNKPNDEVVTLQYTVKFKKEMPCRQGRYETRDDMIERLADELFYNQDRAIEGEIVDLDNFEEIE